MPRPSRNLRLFVAAYPPEECRRELLERLAGLPEAALRGHRPTPVEQVHLTLQFIGDTPERELPEVLESVERSAAGVGRFELRPHRLVTLPEQGAPRLIAAIANAPSALLELQRRLAHRLARRPRQNAGRRYLPHLTLCRYPNGGSERVDLPIEVSGFVIGAIELMQSCLKPGGAEHRRVASVPLASE